MTRDERLCRIIRALVGNRIHELDNEDRALLALVLGGG